MSNVFIAPSQMNLFQYRLILVLDADRTLGTRLVEFVKAETPYQALLATSIIDAHLVLQSFKCDLFLLADHLSPMSREFSEYVCTLPGYEGIPIYFSPIIVPNEGEHQTKQIRSFELDRLLQAMQNRLG